MATATFIYTEDEEDGLPYTEYSISREGIEDLYDLVPFMGDALRGAGYIGADEVQVITSQGTVKESL